jgi:hypothetical protein
MTTGEVLYRALVVFLKEQGQHGYILDQGPGAQLIIPIQGKDSPTLKVPTMELLITDSPETKH